MLRSITFVLLQLIAVSNLAHADWCNIKTCPDKSAHTMCKYKTNTPSKACQKVIRIGLTPSEKNEILKYHNDQRQLVARGGEKRGKPGPQPAAKSMATLKWDDELANIAQRWVNQCIFDHDPCRDIDKYIVGQNIGYWSTAGPATELRPMDTVKAWYEEVVNFNKDEVKSFIYPERNNLLIGHYTQFVWGNTSTVGCATMIHTRGTDNEALTACNYGPTGNFFQEPVYEIKS